MSNKKDIKNLQPITDRFSINENKHLGNGCFGSVYEGYDSKQDKIIAIKHLNRPQNFKDEITTLQKLSTLTHPNIMGFYGYHIDKDNVYLFIQYCPGGTLTSLINDGIPEQKVLTLFRQLVQGMCYMNAKGILHRDLKPDNILIGSKHDIKISDFGLARVDDDGLEKTCHAGTPLYAGPEIYGNIDASYNFTCDVWSAGLILHEMLTGKHPFEHSIYNLKQQWKKFQKGQRSITYPKNFHDQWQYITNYMLTYNNKKRPKFHQILEILKKLDDNGTMRKQIINRKKGIKVEENESLKKVENYLVFLDEKSEILLQLNKLTVEKFRYINYSLQLLLKFLVIMVYTIRLKNIIRNIKYKNLKYPNNDNVFSSTNNTTNQDLFFDKYRNKFEMKLNKQQNYLKQQIYVKLTDQLNKPENNIIYKNLQNAHQLFQQAKQGLYDVQQTYQKQLITVLNFYKIKPTQQRVKQMNINQLRIYALILSIGFFNQEFLDQKYKEIGYISKKLKILNQLSSQELLTVVMRLRNKLG